MPTQLVNLSVLMLQVGGSRGQFIDREVPSGHVQRICSAGLQQSVPTEGEAERHWAELWQQKQSSALVPLPRTSLGARSSSPWLEQQSPGGLSFLSLLLLCFPRVLCPCSEGQRGWLSMGV